MTDETADHISEVSETDSDIFFWWWSSNPQKRTIKYKGKSFGQAILKGLRGQGAIVLQKQYALVAVPQ